jgi:hypothetical protein
VSGNELELGVERPGKALVPAAAAEMAPINPGQLIAQAVEKGLSADAIEKLTRLYVELEERNDRKALFAAIAKAKREFPKFEKTSKYDVTNAAGQKIREGDYAKLEVMLPGAEPVLEANDLFVTWGQQSSNVGMLRVTCTVTHANGQAHTEGFDVTTESRAGMSPQQKFSSATSFGMRLAFMLLFGIVPSTPEEIEREYDNTPVSDEQAATLRAMLDEVKANVPAFLAMMDAESVEKIPARRYGYAVQALEAKRKRA